MLIIELEKEGLAVACKGSAKAKDIKKLGLIRASLQNTGD